MNPFAKCSQASWREQRKLEGELHNLAAWIRVAADNVTKLTETVRSLKQGIGQGGVSAHRFGDASRELDDEARRLAALNEHAASLRERVKKLEQPSRAEAAKRIKGQQALAAIAVERLHADREIGGVVEQLRASLDRRAELSAKMHAHAAELGFSNGGDFLDERRFDALRESLPADLAEKSAEWAASFAGGRPKGSLRCAVLKTLELTETLAHSGCYSAGDEVFLAPGRAAELAACGYVGLPAEYAPARPRQETEDA